MSRIDITIKEIETKDLIVNRGFCRNTHLEIYCEDSNDETISDFANSLYMGIYLDKSNFLDFLFRLAYTIQYLSKTEKEEWTSVMESNPEKLFNEFLADLQASFAFLRSFKMNEDISKFDISII